VLRTLYERMQRCGATRMRASTSTPSRLPN
jgi:hypothetical protein